MTRVEELSGPMDALAREILAGGAIDANDVLRLRQEVFKDGIVEREEADLVFYLNDHGAENDEAWNRFFVGTLTDYFVWKQYPRGVLSDDDGAFLIERVTDDGKIADKTEFDLLVDIVDKARQCPEDVILLVLEAVRESVLEGVGKLFGKDRRRPGVIDRADVEVIRKVVYGTGGGGGFTVTRREAELLFELNNATVDKKNAESWQELFVKAVGNYLMFPAGPPAAIDVEEIRRRDESLASMAEGQGVAGILAGMFSGKALTAGADERRTQKEDLHRKVEEGEEEFRRETVDRAEAEWLIARITEDDIVHDNEKALLAYIKRQASEIDPSLEPFFEKYGI